MRVRRHAPTGIAPPRRPHARTEACSNRGSTLTDDFMLVRSHYPSGVTPKRRSHACTEAGSNRGSTLTEVSYAYRGILQEG